MILFSPFNHEWCTYYLNSGQAKDEQLKEFNDDEQLDNLLMGKPIKKLNPPEIFKFPWKYAENIKPESEIKFGKTAWQKFTSFLMIDL
ncbi:hypothetical protein [Pseudoalteromonas sp. GB43]